MWNGLLSKPFHISLGLSFPSTELEKRLWERGKRMALVDSLGRVVPSVETIVNDCLSPLNAPNLIVLLMTSRITTIDAAIYIT